MSRYDCVGKTIIPIRSDNCPCAIFNYFLEWSYQPLPVFSP